MARTDNLTDFLTDVADAIREKKGTSNPINPQDFSAEIASIQSGGEGFSWDFSRIGYTSDNTTLLQQFEDAIAYSEEKARTFTPSNASTHFREDKDLIFAPLVDISSVTNVDGMFKSSSAMLVVPKLDFSQATAVSNLFYNCTALSCLADELDFSSAKAAGNLFYNCAVISEIPVMKTPLATNMNQLFRSCSCLKKIKELDFGSVTSFGSAFYGCGLLEFALIKNIGKSSLATFDFSGATNWGTGGEGNRQSLIDSLITYSYDRASNGMDTATIKLSANTKALLTEEEIAQITAKGFTIA